MECTRQINAHRYRRLYPKHTQITHRRPYEETSALDIEEATEVAAESDASK